MSIAELSRPPAAIGFHAVWSAAAKRVSTALGRRALLAFLAGTLAIAGLTALRTLDLPLLEAARLAIFDGYQRLAPRPRPAAPVKVVDIDDPSLAAIGQWPWPRHKMALLVDRLTEAGAAVIVFDIVFAEPDRTGPGELAKAFAGSAERASLAALLDRLPDPDLSFASAIARSRVVLGFGLVDRPGEGEPELKTGFAMIGPDPADHLRAFRGAVGNLAVLEAEASGQGSFSVSTDDDEVIRRVPLVQILDGRPVPSLAVEALRVAQGAETLGIRTRSMTKAAAIGRRAGLETLRVGQIDIPVDPDGHVWLHYSERDRAKPLSAGTVLDPDMASNELRKLVGGHIVLVGTSAVGLKDLRATPLNPFEAGVNIHAELLEQILTGWFLARPDWAIGLEIVGSAALGLLLTGLLLAAGPGISAAASVITASIVGYASWLAFTEARLLIDPTYPLLGLMAVYLSVTLVTHMFAEHDKQAIKTAFTHYLAPAIVSRLAEDPAQLKLGGETREMTFLFSDIAGFTSFTERTDPQTLVRLLNRYLDGQCGVVMDHGGTVDKIVGDAVHAIFNAPLDQPDHAARAVSCALAMDAFSQAFEAEQERSGLDFGRTRIGVNSGTAVIGNFGGSRRFDYTAHGDAINTAARLESVNKHLGTRICIAGSTASQCPDLVFRPVGGLVLKGKETAIDAFEPITGRERGYAPLETYRQVFAQLERKDGLAAARFAELATAFPDDPLVQLHAGRLAEGERGATIILKEK